MKYKLIATDMDGTLLTDEHKISDGNKESIINIQKKGVKFVLASGRPSFSMFDSAKELKMDELGGYILSFNGGELIDCTTNKVIFSLGLDENNLREIYEFSKKVNLPMVVYIGDTLYGTELTEYVQEEVDMTGMKFEKFDNIDSLKEKGITSSTKSMLIGSADKISKAEIEMKKLHGNDYFIAISKPIFLEIANKKVNKGKTLIKLGEILGIKSDEMIAVGDGGNDLPLLEVVGMPVAVENAIPAIKEIAKFESSHHMEDALKTLIEHFFNE